MSDTNQGSWTKSLSGRERVRQVVELLDEPLAVAEIAERAEVSRTTADDELERLERDDWVLETTVDSKKAYDLNPVRLLFDEVTNLIDSHTREELEARVTELKADQEELVADYDVDSLAEFRETLATAELSAAELRDRRNVIASWEALNTELRIAKHALYLYADVVKLSSPGTDTPSTFA